MRTPRAVPTMSLKTPTFQVLETGRKPLHGTPRAYCTASDTAPYFAISSIGLPPSKASCALPTIHGATRSTGAPLSPCRTWTCWPLAASLWVPAQRPPGPGTTSSSWPKFGAGPAADAPDSVPPEYVAVARIASDPAYWSNHTSWTTPAADTSPWSPEAFEETSTVVRTPPAPPVAPGGSTHRWTSRSPAVGA